MKQVPTGTSLPEFMSKINFTDRSNFVGRYIGSTTIQTKKILNKIIIDNQILYISEAIFLYHGGSDTFGFEAVEIINDYLAKNKEIIIIFEIAEKELSSFLKTYEQFPAIAEHGYYYIF